jgi:hypothetical protein
LSEEQPIFLLADKSSSWRFESKGITWAIKISIVMYFRHHLTESSGYVLGFHTLLYLAVTELPTMTLSSLPHNCRPCKVAFSPVCFLGLSPDQK